MNNFSAPGRSNQENGADAPKPVRGDTRDRLLDAAWALFIERGFHATRPQDISRLAGVGHGTFYLHFKDKQACFVAFTEKAAEALEKFIEVNSTPGTRQYTAIRETIRLTYEFSRENPGVFGAALTDMRVIGGDAGGPNLMNRWGALWSERLRLAQENGSIQLDVDIDIIGHAIVGMIRQAGERLVDPNIGIEQLVDTLMEFLVSGLGLEKDGD